MRLRAVAEIKYGPLDLRHWGGRIRRNIAPFQFTSGNKVHIIAPGFQSDLASIPDVVRGLLDSWTDRPAFLHDFQRRTKHWSDDDHTAITAKDCDKLFWAGLRAEGVGRVRARTLYLAVRLQAKYRGL